MMIEEIKTEKIMHKKDFINDNVQDVQGIIENVVNRMPFDGGEILYKSEINSQIRIYLFFIILGMIMSLVSLLIWYRVT